VVTQTQPTAEMLLTPKNDLSTRRNITTTIRTYRYDH